MAHTFDPSIPLMSVSVDDRVRRVLLLCSEALRPHACCVEDALRTRGFSVRLEIGKRARRWVRRAPPGPTVMRVLLVPERLDATVADKLRRGTDPTHQGSLQIVGFDTPRGVVTEIERLAGFPAAVRRRPAVPRRVLAHPTLCEEALHHDRKWHVGIAAAVAAFSIGWAGTSVVQHATEPTIARAAPPVTAPAAPAPATERSPLIDTPVYSAIAIPDDTLAFDDDLVTDDDAGVIAIEDDLAVSAADDPSDDEILIFDESPAAMIGSGPAAIEASTPAEDDAATEALLDKAARPHEAAPAPIPDEDPLDVAIPLSELEDAPRAETSALAPSKPQTHAVASIDPFAP